MSSASNKFAANPVGILVYFAIWSVLYIYMIWVGSLMLFKVLLVRSLLKFLMRLLFCQKIRTLVHIVKISMHHKMGLKHIFCLRYLFVVQPSY